MAIIQILPKLVKSISKFSVSYNLPGAGAEKPGKNSPEKGLKPSAAALLAKTTKFLPGKTEKERKNSY